MKLDRNTNGEGIGKYALVKMREIRAMRASLQGGTGNNLQSNLMAAFELLLDAEVITLGNELPGDQFFVMKYHDRFARAGMVGYAAAVRAEVNGMPDGPERDSLNEWADDLAQECMAVEALHFGGETQIPN